MAPPALVAGQQINLVHGIRHDVTKPFWDLQKPGARLPTVSIPTSSDDRPSDIQMSLAFCDTWSDLVAEYFSSYGIPTCCCDGSTTRNSSAFATQPGKDAAVQQLIAQHLSIPIEDANDGAYTSFALVRITKNTATARWDSIKTDDGSADAQAVDRVKAALLALPVPKEDSDTDFVGTYLEFFQTHGTHYVSEIQMGDTALQAFVFRRDTFKRIKNSRTYAGTARTDDPQAIGLFRTYTQMSDFGTGSTLVNTKVATVSRSTKFESIIAPKLKDEVYKLDSSIFMMVNSPDLQAAFLGLPDQVPVSVLLKDLTSLLPIAPAEAVPLGPAGIRPGIITDNNAPLFASATSPDQPGPDSTTGTAQRPAVTAPFCHIFDAAVLQKFGHAATHEAKREDVVGVQPDYASMYQTTLPELVTTAATSIVAISQMYFRLDGIHKQRLLYANETKEVQVFSDVIEINSGLELPGDKITLVCRLLLAAPDDATKKYPVVKLSSAQAFDNVETVAEKVVGVVAFESATTSGTVRRRTIFNGISLINSTTTGDDAPMDVLLEKVVSKKYLSKDFPKLLASYNVQLGIQTTLLVAENVLSYRFNEELSSAALSYVQWLRTSLDLFTDQAEVSKLKLTDEAKGDYSMAYTRAGMLAVAPTDGRNAVLVPRLTWNQYSDLVKQMIDAADSYATSLEFSSLAIANRKDLEATEAQTAALNKNIQAIGKFLLDQNRAQMEKESDVSTMNAQIMDRQQKDLDAALLERSKLKTQFDTQKTAMESAKKAMDKGIEEAKKEAETAAGLAIAGAVFGACAGILEGFAALSELKNAAKILQKLAILAEVLAAIMELARLGDDKASISAKFNAALKLQESQAKADMPTKLDWDNFQADIDGQAGQIANLGVSEAWTWKAEATKLANVGRAITDNALTIVKLQYDKWVQGVQKGVSDKQVARLKYLQGQLNTPDLPKEKAMQINLFELGTLLEARANRTTLALLRTLAIQDAALQYEYFEAPANIAQAASLNIHDVHDLLISQANNKVNALSGLPVPSDLPHPITFTLPAVPIQSLLKDRKFEFPISTSNSLIPLYYKRVRINYVEVQFKGIQPITDSGNAVIVLSSASDFSDRAPNGAAKNYQAVTPASYTYAYTIATGSTTYSNAPASGFVNTFMQMTPFTTWTLSLPDTPENQGFTFPPGPISTQVVVNFYCNAIYDARPPAPSRRLMAMAMRSNATTRDVIRTRDVPGTGGPTNYELQFDTNIQVDSWTDSASKIDYKVAAQLGPLVPKFDIAQDNSTVTVTCALATGRLYPKTTGGPEPVELPSGYFNYVAKFAISIDGFGGGLGLQYNSTSTQITVVEGDAGWKTVKDLNATPDEQGNLPLKYPNQEAVEAVRKLLAAALTYYFTTVKAGTRVLLRSAQENNLEKMTNCSVMKGWDVICAMDADKISDLLRQKWEAEKVHWERDPVTHNAIPTSTVYRISTEKQLVSSTKDPFKTNGRMNTYIQADLLVGPPLISFVCNQPGTCSFRMIIKGGTITNSIKEYPDATSTETINPSGPESAAISGIVDLSVLTGIVENGGDGTYSVCIRLGQGAFTTIMDIPDLQNQALNLAINTTFRGAQFNNKMIFLGSASTVPPGSVWSYLTPQKFYMTTVRPDLAGPGVLLMFIITNGNVGVDRALDKLHNPLPTGHSAALYINTRILFKDMLLSQIREGLDIRAQADPKNHDWCEVVVPKTSSGAIDTSGTYYIKGRSGFVYDSNYTMTVYNWPIKSWNASANVKIPLDQVTIKPTGKTIDTSFNFTFSQKVPYCDVHCDTSDVDFDINVPFEPLRPTINSLQVLSLGAWRKYGSTEVSPHGDGGFWGKLTGKADAISYIKNWCADQFNGTNIGLRGASVFAVSNLLFPNDQVLDLKEAFAPGDLLIVGDVKPQIATRAFTLPASSVRPLTMTAATKPHPTALAAATPHHMAMRTRSLPAIVPAVDPAQLLSELGGRALIDPWTVAVALPTSHINTYLATQATSFWPTSLIPDPVGFNAARIFIRTRLELTLGRPSLQLLADNPGSVQLTIPITAGKVTQDIKMPGSSALVPGQPSDLDPAACTMKATVRLGDVFSNATYYVYMDLSTATVTSLALKPVDGDALEGLAIAGMQQHLTTALQKVAAAVNIAEMTLPANTSVEMPVLDQFGFALVSRSSQNGTEAAIILAAGDRSKMDAVKPPAPLTGLTGLPLAAGSKACAYLSHRMLMDSLLLPAVRMAGATSTQPSLFAAASLQTPAAGSIAQLSTISAGDTILPVYKVADHPKPSATDVDVNISLTGLTIAVDGKVTLLGDSLAAAWQQNWKQKVEYRTINNNVDLQSSTTVPFSLTVTTAPVDTAAPLQLKRGSGGSVSLQFSATKLGTPIVDFDLHNEVINKSNKSSAANVVADHITKALTGLVLVPGFAASGPALALVDQLLRSAAATEGSTVQATQVYVPGDLLLVAP